MTSQLLARVHALVWYVSVQLNRLGLGSGFDTGGPLTGAPKGNKPSGEPKEERNAFPEEEFISALIELGEMARDQREEGQVAQTL